MAKDKELNFFLVFCTSKKKFERYVKNNRISNKYVIDIKKILEEDKINKENTDGERILSVENWGGGGY